MVVTSTNLETERVKVSGSASRNRLMRCPRLMCSRPTGSLRRLGRLECILLSHATRLQKSCAVRQGGPAERLVLGLLENGRNLNKLFVNRAIMRVNDYRSLDALGPRLAL